MPGPILTATGEKIGEHKGLACYTIGQRQGLDIGGPGGPWYVIDKDAAKNALIVGSNEDLFRKDIKIKNVSFVAGYPPPESHKKTGLRVLARIRHRFTPNDATLHVDAGGNATVVYDDPQRAVTPGQSLVLYRGDEVLGGGIIVL